MKSHRLLNNPWFKTVKPEDIRKVMALIRKQGAITLRDIDDDELVEKDHAWASRKPSKRALQKAFYQGTVTVSERAGMLKTYDLASRHFGWERPPKAAPDRQVVEYLQYRALRCQGIVSLESICFGDAPRKAAVRRLIERRVKRREMVPVELEGASKLELWVRPGAIDADHGAVDGLALFLSPFDPLFLQRKRLHLLFDYEHRFEAYVPKAKRVFGYFTLPVLLGDEVVAAVDLKTDRERGKLLMQKWNWVGKGSQRQHKRRIEEELHRFERFQLGR